MNKETLMSQTTYNLKPCPCCGSQKIKLLEGRHAYLCICQFCNAEAPPALGMWRIKEQAIAAWNSMRK